MRRTRAALFGALLLPLTGCVFAVGVDDDKTEGLRDRVRTLEKRVDRLESPGQPVHVLRVMENQETPIKAEPK